MCALHVGGVGNAAGTRYKVGDALVALGYCVGPFKHHLASYRHSLLHCIAGALAHGDDIVGLKGEAGSDVAVVVGEGEYLGGGVAGGE